MNFKNFTPPKTLFKRIGNKKASDDVYGFIGFGKR